MKVTIFLLENDPTVTYMYLTYDPYKDSIKVGDLLGSDIVSYYKCNNGAYDLFVTYMFRFHKKMKTKNLLRYILNNPVKFQITSIETDIDAVNIYNYALGHWRIEKTRLYEFPI